MTRSGYVLGLATAAAAFSAPAHAQNAPRPTFEGPRIEGVVGTDGDLFVGGAVGYDLQRGRLVLGVEGEFDFSDRKHCAPLYINVNDSYCVGGQRDAYIGSRIGIAVARTTLIYAKGGYTGLRQRVTYDSGTATGSFRFVARQDGMRVGAGIEQRLGRNLYVKGEYRYANYENGGWKQDGVVGIGFRF